MVGLLRRFGIGIIPGSSNEHAKTAAVALMHELKGGTTIAIIPDGPRGPSMTLSPSPVFYGQKTGKAPIIGVTYSIANSHIVEKSWDRMLFPTPFNRGICAATEPFFIPQNATEAELEQYRQKIENRLNELTWQLDKELNMPHIPKGTAPKKKRDTQKK